MAPISRSRVRSPRKNEENIMIQKILTVALVGAALASAACNTVRGAARDVNSVANCTENAINGSQRC
jgi:predicted small secreted protein